MRSVDDSPEAANSMLSVKCVPLPGAEPLHRNARRLGCVLDDPQAKAQSLRPHIALPERFEQRIHRFAGHAHTGIDHTRRYVMRMTAPATTTRPPASVYFTALATRLPISVSS